MLYFTSDTHFGHRNIIEYCARPFASVEEMNQTMIDNWNRVVKQEDTVIHLGDFSFSGFPEMCRQMDSLQGHKILVLGNHDKSAGSMQRLGVEVHDQLYVRHEGLVFWCAHVPLRNSGTRRMYKRPEATENYNLALCGHVHDTWKWGPSGELNVGTDVWHFTPVSADVLVNFYNRRTHRNIAS